MRKLPAFALSVVAAFALSVSAFAQDPVAPVTTDSSISDIVSNTDQYVGTTVSIEGNIVDLLNVKAFVLDDGALLATNQVVVVNNTGYEFPLFISNDRRVRVTGVVHPRTNDGGLTNLVSQINMNNGMTPVDPMTQPVDPALVDPNVDPATGQVIEPELVPTDEQAIDPSLEPTAEVIDPTINATVEPVGPVMTDPVNTMGTNPMMSGRPLVNYISEEIIPERLYDWVIIEIRFIEDITNVVQ